MPPKPRQDEVMIGKVIGAYQVLAKLGEGGMGEVYRARDTRLGRDVAIKILPDAFLADAERVARFEREARALASLNHPHIAAIYGIEAGTALVMEFVDGPNLQEVIAKRGSGAPRGLNIDDARGIARQIAEALEAAHDQGIIHRDLKPANVIVRPDGTVKVIDFGLAKGFAADGRGSATDPADSPTVTGSPTEHGAILGTPAYMSPEQARGRAVDKRTDIWSFGVVVYEMLTGARAFIGDGLSDVLAAVVNREIDWSRLPPDTPSHVRALLERCLESDPKLRLRDIGEARVALTAMERSGPGTVTAGAAPSTPRSSRREILGWVVAGLTILIAAAFVASGRMRTGAPAPGPLARLSILPPAGALLNPDSGNTALSPDGRMVAFSVGAGVSSENQLWVRELDSAVARRIESGDGVSLPFWSPDSTRIGFFANRKLKTVDAAGGPAHILCDAPFGRGGAWSSQNVIVFAPDADGPLFRVSTDGGSPVHLTALDATKNETGHRFPLLLPDGNHFLFAALPGTDGVFDIFAGSLKDARVKTLVRTMETAPAYADPGWLVFTRQGVAVAQAFDTATLATSGDVVSLGDEPRTAPGTAAYEAGRRVTASTTGSLAFIPDPGVNTNVEWRDFSGKVIATLGAPAGRYVAVAAAPDNTRAALVRRDAGGALSLWIVDLTRASAVPVATTLAGPAPPVWSPDSRQLAFVEVQDGQRQLSVKNVTDSSLPRRVAPLTSNGAHPRDWAHGEFLISQIDPGTKWNVYRLADSGASELTPVIRGPAIEVGLRRSPDGKWIAYASDEAGRLDLFVQSYPDGGAKAQVSNGGIQTAWWDRNGRDLLFLKRDQTLWRVSLELSTTLPLRIGAPEQAGSFPAALIAIDFAPKAQRFLTLVPERAGLDAITVVQSWRAAVAAHR